MTLTSTALDFTIKPLSGVIGAKINGVDLKQPLSDPLVAELRDALVRYKVIFFPDQHLSPSEHLAFASHFGEITPAHPVIPGLADYPEVFEIDYTQMSRLKATYGDIADRYDGLSWHTDVTFVERPPLGSILNATVSPAAGGDTMWSNQQAAYEGLSDGLRGFLGGLTAVHDGAQTFASALKARDDGGGEWDGQQYQVLEPVEHPVVRTHPESGAKTLFVNPGFTSHIKELSRPESDALLQFLYAHATKPQYTVRYQWRAGDVGFWDNRATMHSVVGDFTGQHRVIQRVTLRGDRPT
ncbi:MAG: Taurine dioxygenase [Actinomycetia bacterium]|nr:Taurine dioxygenase [Actinomycetes bacterium]